MNQAPALVNYNLFTTDVVLREALQRECAGWSEGRVSEFGALVGGEQAIRWGFQANENPPALRTHDRFGERIDEVEFHPAWHELMRMSLGHRLHNLPWAEPREGAQVARAALMMLASQNEQGHTCPVSMTYSSVPALRRQPEIGAEWEPRIAAGALIGMAMTERQGGSDVRANTTQAEAVEGGYRITGHKWFCSAPMSDAFLVLAQAAEGLTCFLLPRRMPDGERNGFHIERLKAKLGNRSNASGEVAFEKAWAQRIGDEGRGVPSIIDMVRHTRLDCVLGSAALMRQALVQAVHHARHRKTFGKLLVDQPLMRAVLADLALESEAATVLAMRLARSFGSESAFARLATAIAKFWVCKRAPVVVNEALECLGGNGYVEECVMPRLYREAPLNSIWEGSGNVICLDILRAMGKEPESLEALRSEIGLARGGHAAFDAFAGRLKQPEEAQARRSAEDWALALQASLLIRHAPGFVSDAFCESRLGAHWGHAFGSLPGGVDARSILERAFAG